MTVAKFIIILLCFVGLVPLSNVPTHADSALDLISGFDAKRIDLVFPSNDEESTGELAKLMYRLGSVDPQILNSRSEPGTSIAVGDATRFSGTVASLTTVAVPSKLVKFLDLETLHLLTISSTGTNVKIVASKIDPKLKAGDRIDGIGVAIESNDSVATAIAAANLRWYPKQVPNVGWQLLRDAGVDIGLISDLPTRGRRPLVAADGDAFYSILAATTALIERDDLAAPRAVQPIAMLQTPDQLSGQWIQVELETVQITRVFVTNPDRQVEIGGDHYYQIDAVGDLQNVIVRIEPSGADDQPALFDGRYPISLVTLRLPEFLQRQIDAKSGKDAVVTQLHTKIGVNAFFFRLWGYESDFMNQHGGANQFGPLLIAASIADREPKPTVMVGLDKIGTMAAIAVIAGVLATFLWHRKTSADDRALRQDRRARESQRIDFPSDSP
jgi:hypothetical protein